MKPKVFLGSTAGAGLMLAGIGGAWVVSNFETVTSKALELGVKMAAKRGVQLTPETAKLLLELTGGVPAATAGATGRAAASTGQRAAGKARQTGTGSRQKGTKSVKSATSKSRGGGSGAEGRQAPRRRPT